MNKMPAIFIGHGSPMNAIEENKFTNNWKQISRKTPTPKAIVSISAHWFTRGTKIMNEESPKTIYDMYGFPKELYEIVYDPPGYPQLASQCKGMITKDSSYDNTWGIDHGTWSVLVHMYPDKNIPVFQISIDATAPPEAHYQIGKELKALREQGVLLFGTGNITHNLRLVDFSLENTGYSWAQEFDNSIKEDILNRKYENVVNYTRLGEIAELAVPTPDHFYPILYILGAAYDDDKISVYNDDCVLGSLSMTSFVFE